MKPTAVLWVVGVLLWLMVTGKIQSIYLVMTAKPATEAHDTPDLPPP